MFFFKGLDVFFSGGCLALGWKIWENVPLALYFPCNFDGCSFVFCLMFSLGACS